MCTETCVNRIHLRPSDAMERGSPASPPKVEPTPLEGSNRAPVGALLYVAIPTERHCAVLPSKKLLILRSSSHSARDSWYTKLARTLFTRTPTDATVSVRARFTPSRTIRRPAHSLSRLAVADSTVCAVQSSTRGQPLHDSLDEAVDTFLKASSLLASSLSTALVLSRVS